MPTGVYHVLLSGGPRSGERIAVDNIYLDVEVAERIPVPRFVDTLDSGFDAPYRQRTVSFRTGVYRRVSETSAVFVGYRD